MNSFVEGLLSGILLLIGFIVACAQVFCSAIASGLVIVAVYQAVTLGAAAMTFGGFITGVITFAAWITGIGAVIIIAVWFIGFRKMFR